MRISLKQILISLAAVSIAIALIVGFVRNAEAIGEFPPVLRALILNGAIVAALVAVFPLYPMFRGRYTAYGLVVCLPALLPGFVYFLYLLPQNLSGGIAAEQLRSDLITDGSSNGIVEIGFSYPIYTPTVNLQNNDLYTTRVNVFLRMSDANGDSALFRGVRSKVPGSGLTVENTVRGMLSQNERYLFNPVTLPPGKKTQGRLVFIVSNLDAGSSFIDAIGSTYQAVFEIRNPVDGTLIQQFPLNHI